MVMPQSDQPGPEEREEGVPPQEGATPGEESVEVTEDVADEVQEEAAVEDVEPDIHQQLEESQQRVLRYQAELENFRKRMRREMEDQQRYAALPIMRDLLPAMDNLRRALDSAEPIDANQGVLSGVQMVCEQLEGILAKHDCSRIKAEGVDFDPNLHEAVVQQPSAEHEPGTVIQEIQPGYQLLDRIVRPSQVIVSQASEERTAGETADQEDPPANQEEDA